MASERDLGGSTPAADESTIGVEAAAPVTEGGTDGHYLIAFQAQSATVFHLPHRGEVVIGRSTSADLRLEDVSVSRRHARIHCADGVADLVDLDSQNGTTVNGERLAEPRRLRSGDSIAVCSATLVYHARARAAAVRPLLDLEQLRERLEVEIDRSVRTGRPFTLLVAELPAGVDRARAVAAWTDGLRPIDVGAAVGREQLLALLPETGEPDAVEAAAQALARLGFAPGVRLGHAGCPADGSDATTLLAAARSAAQLAAPGASAAARQAFQTRTIGAHTVVIADPAMQRLYALIDRIAGAELPVLLLGETGTGKELAASAVHQASARPGPLVALSCAALPESLVESELFGHERGAFTGAVAAKVGLFETARGGTLFLDEIGELSPAVQAKLLRVLETKRITRLGDVRERDIDARLVAATHRPLADEVKAGRFRQDLFFRLSAATLWLPPLRDRPRELSILANHFLAAAAARSGRAMEISDEAMRALAAYAWPGNVRELKNFMDYAAAAVPEAMLQPWHLASGLGGARLAAEPAEAPPAAPAEEAGFRPIEDEVRELERTRMEQALVRSNGNQTHAARLIGMPLRTFQAKVKQFGLGGAARRR
jgi:DNA-binding NtrC family response regulator